MLDRYGYEYVPGPWFRYSVESTPRRQNFVQPDGLLVRLRTGIITVVEVKWSHNVDAYFQLTDRYLPIVRHFFGGDFQYRLLEVVRWYDPGIVFPGAHSLRKDPEGVRPGEVGIHIWKPENRS